MAFSQLTKIFILISLAFVTALAFTPVLLEFLSRNKLGKQIRNDGTTPLYSKLHASKAGTPSMGGVLVWGTLTVLFGLFWFLDRVAHVNFLPIWIFTPAAKRFCLSGHCSVLQLSAS